MVICAQLETHESAVRAFNERLAAGGSEYSFPVRPQQGNAPARSFLAMDGAMDGAQVRGGYILIPHDSLVNGVMQPVTFLQLPLSEGTVTPKYKMVGALLLKDALTRAPLLFGLGMGGTEQPLPRLLKAMGFTLHAVPFYFRIFRPARFLRSIVPLRTTRARRAAFDLAAATHAADPAIRLLHWAKSVHAPSLRSISTEIVPEFSEWADEIWDRAKSSYSMIAARDSAGLQLRFPASAQRLTRLLIRRHGAGIGWAVLSDTQFAGHKYFGDMRVGTLVDALSLPGEEGTVVAAAVSVLRQRGVDLMISNQCARCWGAALGATGFLSSASNFGFAASPKLRQLLASDPAFDRVHLCRGDGDGPIHL